MASIGLCLRRQTTKHLYLNLLTLCGRNEQLRSQTILTLLTLNRRHETCIRLRLKLARCLQLQFRKSALEKPSPKQIARRPGSTWEPSMRPRRMSTELKSQAMKCRRGCRTDGDRLIRIAQPYR